MTSLLRFLRKIASPGEFALFGTALLAFAILTIGVLPLRPFHSVEVKFTDASTHLLRIVPASCPSNPHYAGECGLGGPGYAESSYVGDRAGVRGCTPSVACLNGTTVHSISAQCVAQDVSCPQYWSCGAGACVPPPAATFVAFSATGLDGSAFSATGHLEARPILVAPGSTSHLYWNVQDAQSCAVTGSNGDKWTVASSGSVGVETSAITQQTIYTLTCQSHPGATPPSIQDQVTINVVPTFHEI